MGTNLTKIKSIIAASLLPKEDQEELISVFTKTSDSELAPIKELLDSNPSWVEKLSANYKVKRAVLDTGDMESWRTIIKEEAKELDKI